MGLAIITIMCEMRIRRVDADEQADGEVGQRQIEDEVVTVRAEFAVDSESDDDQRVSGDRDDPSLVRLA